MLEPACRSARQQVLEIREMMEDDTPRYTRSLRHLVRRRLEVPLGKQAKQRRDDGLTRPLCPRSPPIRIRLRLLFATHEPQSNYLHSECKYIFALAVQKVVAYFSTRRGDISLAQ